MSHDRGPRLGSASSILTISESEYGDFFKGDYDTNLLVEDTLKIIERHRNLLRAAQPRFRLDELLSAMVKHAPHEDGKRYVAIVLHIADNESRKNENSSDAVVKVAEAWFDYLMMPMKTLAMKFETDPSTSQSPELDSAQDTRSVTREQQPSMRKQVARRERYFCPITKTFDIMRAVELEKQGTAMPADAPAAANWRHMEVAHIIPYSLNDFKEASSGVRDAAITWDMLRAWTNLDLDKLCGSKINTPANAIYMWHDAHKEFGRFSFYLDKDAYPNDPNKYKVKTLGMTLVEDSGDVKFETSDESGRSIDPPDPELLRIHAAFARVLRLSGAADYIERVERDADDYGTLAPSGETDIGFLLSTRLSVLAH